MIDIYIEVSVGIRRNSVPINPAIGIDYYSNYRNKETELLENSLYIYVNDFILHEKNDFLFESSIHWFIAIGKVFYRNKLLNNLNAKSLNLLEVYGIINNYDDFFSKIKGNYIAIIIDKRTFRVDIINSPLGVIPFYYYVDNDRYIFSTNLSMILSNLANPSINKLALIQYSIFDTILGNNTLIKEISQLQYGQRVSISDGKYTVNQYYQFNNLYNNAPRNRKESIDEISVAMKINMKNLPLNSPFLLGLTGGFDGRLNLALIDKENYDNIISYTYGMKNSTEIKIAREVAAKLNIRHEIIELEEEYEREYLHNADEVLLISDGFAPFMRCNYYYAHKKLSQFSRECITGMYGSEIIRPMHVMADDVSLTTETVKAFLSPDVKKELEKLFLNHKHHGFFNPEIFTNELCDELINFINTQYLRNWQELPKEIALYNFYLNEGMRKFFMEILRIDKFFINHHIPYLDLDFFELIIPSAYAGIHNNAFKENPYYRRKGQFLYMDVIERFNKQLNYIKVDRGYYPYQLRGGLSWFSVGVGFILGKKLRKVIKGNDTFNTKVWRNNVYEKNIQFLKKKDSIFNMELFNKFQSGYHLLTRNEHVYARHYSIKRWMELNNGLL